jgi:hypothetical protein
LIGTVAPPLKTVTNYCSRRAHARAEVGSAARPHPYTSFLRARHPPREHVVAPGRRPGYSTRLQTPRRPRSTSARRRDRVPHGTVVGSTPSSRRMAASFSDPTSPRPKSSSPPRPGAPQRQEAGQVHRHIRHTSMTAEVSSDVCLPFFKPSICFPLKVYMPP